MKLPDAWWKKAKARKAELSQPVEASKAEVNVVEVQAPIASACALSLKDERQRKAVQSEDEIKADA